MEISPESAVSDGDTEVDVTIQGDMICEENMDASNKVKHIRRLSRAGTRSVSKLSPAQLERKRATDREAQRAIRTRNKEQLDSLQLQVVNLEEQRNDLKRAVDDEKKRIEELESKVGDLQHENAFLKSRLGEESFPALSNPTGGLRLRIEFVDFNDIRTPAIDSAIAPDTSTFPIQNSLAYPMVDQGNPAQLSPDWTRQSISTNSTSSSAYLDSWQQQAHCDGYRGWDGATNIARSQPASFRFPNRPSHDEYVSRNPSSIHTPSIDTRSMPTPISFDTLERANWSASGNWNVMMDSAQQSPDHDVMMSFPEQPLERELSNYSMGPPCQPSPNPNFEIFQSGVSLDFYHMGGGRNNEEQQPQPQQLQTVEIPSDQITYEIPNVHIPLQRPLIVRSQSGQQTVLQVANHSPTITSQIQRHIKTENTDVVQTQKKRK